MNDEVIRVDESLINIERCNVRIRFYEWTMPKIKLDTDYTNYQPFEPHRKLKNS